jgi:hypothetical protein
MDGRGIPPSRAGRPRGAHARWRLSGVGGMAAGMTALGPPLDAVAAPIEAVLDPVSLAVEAIFDAIASDVQPLGEPGLAGGLSTFRPAVEPLVDGLAAPVEALVDRFPSVVGCERRAGRGGGQGKTQAGDDLLACGLHGMLLSVSDGVTRLSTHEPPRR